MSNTHENDPRDAWHKERADKSEIQELIRVGDVEISEAEIVDLWFDSRKGHYLQLTEGRTLPVPAEEEQKVRDFLEYRNFNIGMHRALKFGGETVYDYEIFKVVHEDGGIFMKLQDGRSIEIDHIEEPMVESFVIRNKKIRGEI